MSGNKNIKGLELILDKIMRSIEISKNEIFEISESTRLEIENIKKQLTETMNKLAAVINDVDLTEMQYKRSRLHLAEVSKSFHRHKESDIKNAYDTAHSLQTKLAILRANEENLKSIRDNLQWQMRLQEKTIERAENLIGQLNVIFKYLQGDLLAVIESAQHRQLLGLKIIQAQEDERKRVAREIHDGPAQSMANVVLRAEIVERFLKQEDLSAVRKELKELKEIIRGSLEEVRRIIYNLRPMALDDLGLIPTLRKYLQDIQVTSKLKIDFLTTGKDLRLDPALEVAIFRIVQETITNVVKHARAKNAQVKLDFLHSGIDIAVRDDGIGFNVEEKQESAHFGILGMQERVNLLEGELRIDSKLNSGTTILINIPLKEKHEVGENGEGKN